MKAKLIVWEDDGTKSEAYYPNVEVTTDLSQEDMAIVYFKFQGRMSKKDHHGW